MLGLALHSLSGPLLTSNEIFRKGQGQERSLLWLKPPGKVLLFLSYLGF